MQVLSQSPPFPVRRLIEFAERRADACPRGRPRRPVAARGGAAPHPPAALGPQGRRRARPPPPPPASSARSCGPPSRGRTSPPTLWDQNRRAGDAVGGQVGEGA